MTNALSIESLRAEASSAVSALRKIAADSPVAAKVADILEDLESRLAKVELSFVESDRTRPIPHRRG